MSGATYLDCIYVMAEIHAIKPTFAVHSFLPKNKRGSFGENRTTSAWRRGVATKSLEPMGRLRACFRLRRLLETRPPTSSPSPARVPHLYARTSPFSSAVAVAAAAPHDARDSGLGTSAYWAWIRAAAEAAPAPAPPQEEEEEGLSRYIPVKAYFLSTR